MNFRVETLAIGDELLTGKISDTNSTFVSAELFALGIVVARQSVIADDEKEIENELKECSKRSQVVICFGGLGPTSDDLTVDCAARFLGSDVGYDPSQRVKLESRYRELKRDITESSLRQIRFPTQAKVFKNDTGLAPGFCFEKGGCLFFFLPGVPSEMRPMVVDSVLPIIKSRIGKTQKVHSHFWRCLGIPESELQELMNPIESQLPENAWLGYRTSYPENQLLLYFREEPLGLENFEKLKFQISQLVANYCYTESCGSIEETVMEELNRQNLKIALVESCTGGLCTNRLTRVAGSSKNVWGGLTLYQVEAKQKVLGLSLTEEREAVSARCSQQLASRAKALSQCDISAAITGYMGPGGGHEGVPVGTVFTSVATPSGVLNNRFMLGRPVRERRQWGAATFLLREIHRALLGLKR